jgi:hypothetical protein
VIINTADLTYADNYGATSPDVLGGTGTNQNREDTWHVLWEEVLSVTPTLQAAGSK